MRIVINVNTYKVSLAPLILIMYEQVNILT